MLPEAKRYYRESKSSGSSRGGRRSESRSRSSRTPTTGKKTKNPATFELLGIGLAAGLCIGFIAGFTFNNMTETGPVVPSSASSSGNGSNEGGASQAGGPSTAVAGRMSEEQRKQQRIKTQQTIQDWEKDTFDLQDSNKSSSGYKNKALSIIDGLDETLAEEEKAQKARPALPDKPYIRTD